jgi:hypothetical protein
MLRSARNRNLWQQQSGLCGICRMPIDLDRDQVVEDYILPHTHSGSRDLSSLQLAHQTCNDRKRSYLSPPDANIAERFWTIAAVIQQIETAYFRHAVKEAERAMQVIDWCISQGMTVGTESRAKYGRIYLRWDGVNLISLWATQRYFWIHVCGSTSSPRGLIDFPSFRADQSRLKLYHRLRQNVPGLSRNKTWQKTDANLLQWNPTLPLKVLINQQGFEGFLATIEWMIEELRGD